MNRQIIIHVQSPRQDPPSEASSLRIQPVTQLRIQSSLPFYYAAITGTLKLIPAPKRCANLLRLGNEMRNERVIIWLFTICYKFYIKEILLFVDEN